MQLTRGTSTSVALEVFCRFLKKTELFRFFIPLEIPIPDVVEDSSPLPLPLPPPPQTMKAREACRSITC